MRTTFSIVSLLLVSFGLLSPVDEASAFQTQTSTSAWILQRKQVKTSVLTRWSSTETRSDLQGVTEFENWFTKCDGSKCDARIVHSTFEELRGLTWKGSASAASGCLASVPGAVALQSDESQSNWDALLASKLWKEVLKGSNSSLYGYVCLLTQGHFHATSTDSAPPSTAPNALRHWTAAQRERLSVQPVGQKLIDLEARQAKDWQQKYQQLAAVDRPASLEQFVWAMEVVHSRAFRGLDQNFLSSLPAILAPVAAGAIGWAYFASTAFPNDAVFYGLGVLAIFPSVWNIVSGGGPRSVVLLPLIDSANHLESAGSSIELNPLSGAFEFSLQPSCVVAEPDGQQQLYITYGSKKDTELLLNYGFLPSISGGAGVDDEARESQRQQLADAFLSRNGQDQSPVDA